jgi:FkbM family methyltransferase
LRTFKKHLLNSCDDAQFKDADGKWYKAGGDGSVFYALIEAADPLKVKCLQDVVYNYNDINPLNDYKVNAAEQNKNAREIVNMSTEKKRILIAIPTARNIEPETFKSIYDLQVPEGYQTTFQYFYGYNIDQVRNLIADWAVKGYDYLFSVDSDISFAPDTLVKLLAHDKPVVSGLYIQRKPGQHILEIYEHNANGGVSNVPYGKIKGRGLVEIAGCGFGCVLVKSEVLKSVGYPQFKYYSALDHNHTVSEDVDFCRKALGKGFKIYADTTIQCRHTGSFTFAVDNNIPAAAPAEAPDIKARLRELGSQRLIPKDHVDYLTALKAQGFEPRVIYDIGACVLHWTNESKRIWPNAETVAFEAMDSSEFLYKEQGLKYHIGVLSNETGKTVDFYQNDWHPGGNSYYKENEVVNPNAPDYFNEQHKRTLKTVTLNAVVNLKQFPLPDLIKMDVQGAEMDVLQGASEVLKTVKHVILELQTVEYNKGAPLKDTVIEYMDSIGFDCKGLFSNNGPDGDYHFVKR